MFYSRHMSNWKLAKVIHYLLHSTKCNLLSKRALWCFVFSIIQWICLTKIYSNTKTIHEGNLRNFSSISKTHFNCLLYLAEYVIIHFVVVWCTDYCFFCTIVYSIELERCFEENKLCFSFLLNFYAVLLLLNVLRSWNWLSAAERIKEQEFTKEYVFLFETDFLNNEPIKYAQDIIQRPIIWRNSFCEG